MKLNCIVVCADLHIPTPWRDYLNIMPNTELTATCKTIEKAIEIASEIQEIDLVFLEINSSGHVPSQEEIRALAAKIRFVILVLDDDIGYQPIVTTLFKPFTILDLQEITSRIERLKKDRYPCPDTDFFFIRNQNRVTRCLFSEIIAIEIKDKDLYIYTISATLFVSISLDEMERQLKDKYIFIKVHRSFIISKLHIDYVEDRSIQMRRLPKKIPIGAFYKKNLNKFIDSNLLKKNW